MLYKIKSNPMHSLSGSLPLAYVRARVTRGALVTHRHSFAPPRCRSSQYRKSLSPSVTLWNDLDLLVFDGVELEGFKSRANASLLAKSALFLSLTIFSLSSIHSSWLCGVEVFGLIECSTNQQQLQLAKSCPAADQQQPKMASTSLN